MFKLLPINTNSIGITKIKDVIFQNLNRFLHEFLMLKVNINSRGGTKIIFYLFWLYINLYSLLTFYIFSILAKKNII